MSNTPEKAKYRKATTAEIIAINKALEEVIIKTDDGFVEYRPGHSDQTIADEIGDGVTKIMVSRIRVEMFGHMKRSTASPGVAFTDMENRLSEMEGRMDEAEAAIEKLRAAIKLASSGAKVSV